MPRIPAEPAAPNSTKSTEPTCVKDPAAPSLSRREAYEAGFRQNQWELEAARSELSRWKGEAEWWREEYNRLMTEMLELTVQFESELRKR
jgi:hypothetical protein